MKNKHPYLTPKLITCLRGYSGPQLIKDIVAGIIVAIIALPLSIALALASGVEPAAGVYTAVTAGFVIALFGGSRVQISGPTAAFATIVAGIVATHGMDGLIIATILAGLILILMGICKLGALIRFIPYTITTGFTAGIAVTILVGQIKDFLGLSYADGVKPVETIEKLEANLEALGTFSWQALVVGLVCLAILIVYPRFEKRVPPSLIAVVAGILMVKFIPGMDAGVATIGELYTIPTGLPQFTLGTLQFSWDQVGALLPSAFTIAILAAIESLLSCVVADSMINSRHNSNMELVAQGLGNVASALFGGIPATGAIARTAANVKNGGRTPIAGMVHAVVLLIMLLFLMPLAGLIPMPTIAAILFMVAYNMCGWRSFVQVIKTAPVADILVMVITFVLTVVFDLVVAIEVGMVLAAMLFMKSMSENAIVSGWKYSSDDAEVTERDADSILLRSVPHHVRVYEISGPMFFGAAEKIAEITLKDFTTCLVLRMRGVPAVDATAMGSLEALYEKCSKNGVALVFSHVNEQPLAVMKHGGFYDKVGADHFQPHIDDALAFADKFAPEK